MRKIQVGLLGLGTVGMGVYKLLRKRAETMDKTIGAQLEIKKILVHNKNKKREGVDETLLTDDWKEIIEDDEYADDEEDDEDMDDLKYLVSKGINVYAQDVPGDPKSAIE